MHGVCMEESLHGRGDEEEAEEERQEESTAQGLYSLVGRGLVVLLVVLAHHPIAGAAAAAGCMLLACVLGCGGLHIFPPPC